ncbi:hypothetical protein HT747_01480 [Brevibacillus borstelensis]|uniref:Uncharacterized protein n=1 Tax=Brevibacillus gelatini TaxID=1655277 RepID=A0A3M8BF16_9BACL|nr:MULTISPECIES: hypothetical protein [Brevibacillus]MBE5393856.1 hypothetical protein [Brevibacillus borstelensis]RNB62018.1 hypothetical protein EDM57_00225 [Brevibacillus gelatini]
MLQLRVDDSYTAMIQILAEMVTSFLSTNQKRKKQSQINESIRRHILVLLDQEAEEYADFELTAELLGTREFRQIA